MDGQPCSASMEYAKAGHIDPFGEPRVLIGRIAFLKDGEQVSEDGVGCACPREVEQRFGRQLGFVGEERGRAVEEDPGDAGQRSSRYTFSHDLEDQWAAQARTAASPASGLAPAEESSERWFSAQRAFRDRRWWEHVLWIRGAPCRVNLMWTDRGNPACIRR